MSRSPASGAAPGLPFLAPRFSPFALALVRMISPLYLRLGEGIGEVRVEGEDEFVREFAGFHAGTQRLVLAFRHPSVSDAPLLAWFFARRLPRRARSRGWSVPRRNFVHFLYGRGVPVWAGAAVSWFLPRLAAIPVYHRRNDSRGMREVRRIAAEGPFPLAIAPEGQVTYHNGSFGALEGGIGRIVEWCRQDLAAAGEAGTGRSVRILPLSIYYRHGASAGKALDRVIRRFEKETGIPVGASSADTAGRLATALLQATRRLLDQLEGCYTRFLEAPRSGPPQRDDPGGLRGRIETLCAAALRAGEQAHGISSDGSLLDRVFRLRDAGWRAMFRDDLSELSAMERRFADARADTARLLTRHMELVDVLEYLDPRGIDPRGMDATVLDRPCAETGALWDRLVEYSLDLVDVVNRVEGGTIADRPRIRGRRAVIRAGRPVSAEELTSAGGAGAQRPGRRDRARAVQAYVEQEFSRLLQE